MLDLAFDKSHGRLASVGGGEVRIWDVTDSGRLSVNIILYSTRADCNLGRLVPSMDDRPQKDVTARSVQFLDGGDEVLIGYIESHEV